MTFKQEMNFESARLIRTRLKQGKKESGEKLWVKLTPFGIAFFSKKNYAKSRFFNRIKILHQLIGDMF